MHVIATGLLALLAVVFVATLPLRSSHVVFALINAFAEAGTIGALADWFAVVALFRHPLGIPIPHTAIVPRNKSKLGASLSQFVMGSFLTEESIRQKIASFDLVDTARRTVGANRDAIVERAAALVPRALEGAGHPEVRRFVADNAGRIVEWLPLPELLALMLEWLVESRQHQEILTSAVEIGGRLVSGEEETIRAKVRDRLPVGTKTLLTDVVTEELMQGITGLLTDVARDPRHSMRVKLDQQVRETIQTLREHPERIAAVARIRERLAAPGLLEGALDRLRGEAGTWAERDLAQGGDSGVRGAVARALDALEALLESDAALRERINAVLRDVLTRLVAGNVAAVGEIITETVNRWDMETLSTRIEQQVGNDLQYIRVNGSLVGGLVGVLIYLASQLVTRLM
jgi:uncharacterized membrane-anchored protein YjiN (DUF445 family)